MPQQTVAAPGLFVVVVNRRAFAADLARHDELQSAGWITRRFAWEHVMRREAWVVGQVRVALAQRRLARETRQAA